MKLGLGLSLANRGGAGGISSPIPLSGLSLWLKADAGVSKLSYNYASQIVISGTSTPNVNGTYTATTVPGYGNQEPDRLDTYALTSPNGKTINWDNGENSFLLDNSFSSGSGTTWSVYQPYVSQIIITGFTGIYSNANGTYNGNGDDFTKAGPNQDYFIHNNELIQTGSEEVIATAPENYSGSWTPTSYVSSVTLAGAGISSVDGLYTRTDTQVNMYPVNFSASGGREIYFDQSNWWVGNELYLSYNLYDWEGNPDPEAPTGSLGTSSRSVGSPTSTTVIVPTGSISGVVTTSTVNTQGVLSWADQSGEGNNASVEFQGEQPTFVSSFLNGKPAIKFNGQGQCLQVASSASLDFTAETSCFIVVKYDGDGGPNDVIYIKNADDGFSGYPAMYGMVGVNAENGNVSFPLNAGGWSDHDSGVSISDGIPQLFSMIFNTNVGQSIYCNGILTGQQVLGDNINTSSGTLQIGGYNKSFDSQDFFNGKIAEIIMYNRAVTNTERQQVEAYLMDKYAICLDATSSVLMTGWVAGPRTLTPIGYAPYGNETYTYGDEVVRYETGVWIYGNSGLGEIARAYSTASRPWLATWPAGFTAQKICS